MNKKQMQYIIVIAVIIALAFLLKTKYITVATVPSDSMESTINRGEIVIGVRKAWQIKCGDIVIFRHPGKPQAYIKRVIGIPGDTVTIVKGQVYINGKLLDEPYVKDNWDTTGEIQVYKVKSGEYFVLGDNRLNSEDSRYLGFVTEENVYARAVAVCYPLENCRILASQLPTT